MPRIKQQYTAAELARLAGVLERTVRFYVQEGVISPPSGRGRGAHFDERHLSQLRGVRLLQGAGLDLAAIRQHREDLEAALKSRGFALESAETIWSNFASHVVHPEPPVQGEAPKTIVPAVTALSRLHIAPGLEMLIGTPHRLPSPARLAELARLIRKAFGVKEETEDEDSGCESP
ncbi:MAG TPA: MerR family transcriptional regulator [Aliidongia sp.]|nr:MerR family transcriptional regulator [Aliidongia sp.]